MTLTQLLAESAARAARIKRLHDESCATWETWESEAPDARGWLQTVQWEGCHACAVQIPLREVVS